MSLIDNLNAINNCKEDIKRALADKGVDMTDVKFSEYAGKIDALTFEPGGDSPTPSADYIYSNGYVEGGDETKDIISFEPYEITLGADGKSAIELICPPEIYGRDNEGGDILCYDVIFTFDVPTTYDIDKLEFYNPIGLVYESRPYKKNPRYINNDGKVYRNGIEYNSYVRQTSDNLDLYSEDVQEGTFKYRITIIKK